MREDTNAIIRTQLEKYSFLIRVCVYTNHPQLGLGPSNRTETNYSAFSYINHCMATHPPNKQKLTVITIINHNLVVFCIEMPPFLMGPPFHTDHSLSSPLYSHRFIATNTVSEIETLIGYKFSHFFLDPSLNPLLLFFL